MNVAQPTYFAIDQVFAFTGPVEPPRHFDISEKLRCGVVAVPTQVFYDHPDEGRHLVRFAFCKQDAVLTEAVRRLATLSP